MKRAGLTLVAVLALSGCSQVAAIAPVGGDHLAQVRFAAQDVLVSEDIEILTAPVCVTASDGAVSCEGATVDGQTITVTSTATDVTVVVGSETLYSGNILDALDTAVSG